MIDLVGMEACAGAHHWARMLVARGYRVKLMAPQFVKPYVKSNKNDLQDAEAICEAMSRPTMRFVTVKSVEQQDLQAVHRIRWVGRWRTSADRCAPRGLPRRTRRAARRRRRPEATAAGSARAKRHRPRISRGQRRRRVGRPGTCVPAAALRRRRDTATGRPPRRVRRDAMPCGSILFLELPKLPLQLLEATLELFDLRLQASLDLLLPSQLPRGGHLVVTHRATA